MFHCASIEQVAKIAMVFALLMFSALSQAESSDSAGVSGSAEKTESGLKVAADDQPRDFKFPAWPERQQSNRSVIPPPPPGPYMSSALSDFSVSAPAFGGNHDSYEMNKPVFQSNPSDIPMQTFSPDRPWMDHAYRKHKYNVECPPACSPQRWMPENGYQYAPLVKKRSYPVMQNRMPVQPNMPDMNRSGSRLPSMGSAPIGQYRYAPNHAPRYNAPMN